MLLRVNGIAFLDLPKVVVVRVDGLHEVGGEAYLLGRLAYAIFLVLDLEIDLIHEPQNAIKLLNNLLRTLGGVNTEAGRIMHKVLRVKEQLRGRRRHVVVAEGATLSMHGIRARHTDKRLAALKRHHTERTKGHDLGVAPRAAGTKGLGRALKELHDLFAVVLPDFDREMANTAGHDETRATRRLKSVAFTVVRIANHKAFFATLVGGGRRGTAEHRSTRHGDR